jgi:hypothetical protein
MRPPSDTDACDEHSVFSRPSMSDETQAPEAKDEPPKKKKAAWRLKLEALVAEYGTAAIITWFSIFLLTWLFFIVAISLGFEVDSGGEGTGVIAIAYVATQLTKPIRIAATVFLTPVVVKVWHRVFPPKPKPKAKDEDEDEGEAANVTAAPNDLDEFPFDVRAS